MAIHPSTDNQTELITQAAQLLKSGELVAFPTETVYGLGADALNEKAIERLYTAKGRPTNHPVIVHLASADRLEQWAQNIPQAARCLANVFWPGPLTLILNRQPHVPDSVTGGQDTVGLRVPDHPVALALLNAFDGGLVAPSANRFGRLSPTTAEHVAHEFASEVEGKSPVALILDGDACEVGVESTIVAFVDGQPVILRPGMITAEDIAKALHSETQSKPASNVTKHPDRDGYRPKANIIRAPGTLAKHYAPATPLKLVAPEAMQDAVSCRLKNTDARIAVLAQQNRLPSTQAEGRLIWDVMPETPPEFARELYARLRTLDLANVDVIFVERVPETDAWSAIADRLRRAATTHAHHK